MIFSKSISELNIEDIETFCQKGVKEGFSLDYKEDFPRDLAKSICAFANTFGGVILIGIEEDEEGKPRLPIKGIPFEKGLHEKVINIILDNINPPLFPEINIIRFERESNILAVIVINILQSDETPYAIDNKKSVYVRTDNRNKLEEVATMEQIGWLLNKRRKSEELKQSLYSNAEERLMDIYKSIEMVGGTIIPNGLKPPKGQAILSVVPVFPNKPLLGVQELKNLCSGKDLRTWDYFGALQSFPYFNQEPKTTQQSVISYYFNETRKELFFYEFNIYGLFFYQEPLGAFIDKKGKKEHGGKINAIWFHRTLARIDQFLEIAERFYEKTAVWGLIEIKLKLNDIFGLKISKPEPFFDFLEDNWVSNQKNLEITKILTKQELKEKRIEVLKDIFREVCLTFNFDIEDKVAESYLRKNKRLP